MGSSDTKKTQTMGGNEFMEGVIRWGSRDDSKELFRFNVHWDKGEEKPTVTITKEY